MSFKLHFTHLLLLFSSQTRIHITHNAFICNSTSAACPTGVTVANPKYFTAHYLIVLLHKCLRGKVSIQTRCPTRTIVTTRLHFLAERALPRTARDERVRACVCVGESSLSSAAARASRELWLAGSGEKRIVIGRSVCHASTNSMRTLFVNALCTNIFYLTFIF